MNTVAFQIATEIDKMLRSGAFRADPFELVSQQLSGQLNKAMKDITGVIFEDLKTKPNWGSGVTDVLKAANWENLLQNPMEEILAQATDEVLDNARKETIRLLEKKFIHIAVEDYSQEVASTLDDRHIRLAKSVADRKFGEFREILNMAYEEGMGISDAAEVLRTNAFAGAQWEAERIARTEINEAQNLAAHDLLKQNRVEYEQWITAVDGREREDHRSLHGIITKTEDKFPNGLEYPGQEAGDPKNFINCRCRLVPYIMPLGMQPPVSSKYSGWFREADIIPDEGGLHSEDTVFDDDDEFNPDRDLLAKNLTEDDLYQRMDEGIELIGEQETWEEEIQALQRDAFSLEEADRYEAMFEARRAYTSMEYDKMVGGLRSGDFDAVQWDRVHALDDALEQTAFHTQSTKVYFRGMKDRGNIFGSQHYIPGTVETDPGFTSSSPNIFTASAFSDGTYLEIEVPQGTPYLPGHYRESEMIFSRNSRYVVDGITEVPLDEMPQMSRGLSRTHSMNDIAAVGVNAKTHDSDGRPMARVIKVRMLHPDEPMPEGMVDSSEIDRSPAIRPGILSEQEAQTLGLQVTDDPPPGVNMIESASEVNDEEINMLKKEKYAGAHPKITEEGYFWGDTGIPLTEHEINQIHFEKQKGTPMVTKPDGTIAGASKNPYHSDEILFYGVSGEEL